MLYLSFPVTMFWISNQAEYFEEYIVKRKREIFPPDDEQRVSFFIDLNQANDNFLNTSDKTTDVKHNMWSWLFYVHLQRKEMEDFKERMRARKEQQLLKALTMGSENWELSVKEMLLYNLHHCWRFICPYLLGKTKTGGTAVRAWHMEIFEYTPNMPLSYMCHWISLGTLELPEFFVFKWLVICCDCIVIK